MPHPLIPGTYCAPVENMYRVGMKLFWEIFATALEYKMYEWTCAQTEQPVEPDRQVIYQAMIRLLRLSGEPHFKHGEGGSWEEEIQRLFDTTHTGRRARERWLIEHGLPVS